MQPTHPTTARRRSRLVISSTFAAAVLPLAFLIPFTGAADAAPAQTGAKHRYIVMTAGEPLASYDGGVTGYQPTSPKAGRKLDTRSANARAYARYLASRHDGTLARAGVAASAKTIDFNVAFNGFAAELTAAQADALGKTSGVSFVWRDEVRYADTITTPDFLGLSGSTGVWQKRFGGQSRAGEGIIVGDLDTGFWPENPSFAALPTPRPDQAAIDAKWNGTCDTGTSGEIACNNKVIGARYYAEGNTVEDFEFLSPRDFNGHGSHTAGTAAGNAGVNAVINGGSVGTISGMAPAARLAVYKVLWATPDGRASGSTSSIVSAIDDAVADGVDVINFSISGSRQYVVSPDELAFFGAADAGVFVSASAGNEGDTLGESSVAHNAPWEMTVAASTHDRGSVNSVVLGNGATYTGVGVSDTGVGPAPLVDSTQAAAPGETTDAQLCLSSASNGGTPALDPAKVSGKIVVCTRGNNARVDKSQAVADAGGVGMVLANTSDAQSLNADFHVVPSSHVNATAGTAIKAYAVTANPTARITPRDTTPVRAPEMAGFSSFGPALAGGGDLLKPDITAPGVDVIAAVAPPGNGGNSFNAYSGTSMSAPHIAGIAALIRQAHPTWAPMWVKSALMTNATPLDNRGLPIQRAGRNATPLDYGNGHVVPGKSFDPGLVYDSTSLDWVRWGCGIGQFQLVTAPSFCQTYGSIEPSNLNYASIAVSGLAGTQTVTRTVTNTSVDQASQYKPAVVAPPGVTVKLSAAKLTVPPLQSRTFSVTFTRTTAPLGQWAFGSLTWTDKRGHSVRSALAVEPVAAAVPTEVVGTGTSGSQVVSVTPGYTGILAAPVAGLVAAQVDTATTPKPTDSVVTVEIPAGTKVARFATYDADYPAGTDVDITVRQAGTIVGQSAGGTAEESVTLDGADLLGSYEVTIDYFAGTPDTLDVELNSFALGSTAAGNLSATPASQPVTIGRPASVTLAWSGLMADTRYLGAVNWSDGTATVGRSLVSILP